MIGSSPRPARELHYASNRASAFSVCRQRKRVPIHRELVPILRRVLQGPALITGKVFTLTDDKGIREIGLETFKNVWPRACESLSHEEGDEAPLLQKPFPRFHDLRATWKTYARRSEMHREIEMAIMGHSQRKRSVHERYGRISDQEPLQAIDKMTFDHGETEILVADRKEEPAGKNGDWMATGTMSQRKRSGAHLTLAK